jgi:hypothetical protein
VNSVNCGEAFYYTDCITLSTVQIGGQFNNQIEAWFDPVFGANPLTICSCDVPDLSLLGSCDGTSTLIGLCSADPCSCYEITISELDLPGSNPVRVNVQRCDGIWETLVFNTYGVYNYCLRNHYGLYQSGPPQWTSAVNSTINGPFGPCVNNGDCT